MKNLSCLNTLFLVFLIAGSMIASGAAFAQSGGPKPRVIKLNPVSPDSMDIFTGPPGTVTMHSGYMVLAPGRAVGKHTTGRMEEALIVFAGNGEMRLVNGPTLKLGPYTVAYCPPGMEHDVYNTGKDTLRYIWLVARAK